MTGWIPVLLLFVLGAVYAFIRVRRAPKADDETLRQPKLLLYAGIAGCLLLGGLLAALGLFFPLPINAGMAAVGAILLLFLLASFAMLLAYANWRVELREESFTYHTFLGNERPYSYADILSYAYGVDSLIAHMKDGRKLHFEKINADAFALLLSRALNAPGAGERIAERRPRFLGMEMSSRRRLAAVVLLVTYLLFGACGAVLLLLVKPEAPYSQANVCLETIRYESGEVLGRYGRNARFRFKNDKGAAYLVDSLAYDVFAVEDFLNDIKKGDILYLRVPADQADAGASPLDVVSIENREWSYLSMEDVNRRHVENGILGRGMGAVLLPLSVLLMFMTLYTLRHPDRLPRFQRGFFGRDYKSHL